MAVSFMKNKNNPIVGVDLAKMPEETPKVEVPEWIWVEGYKGTDKDMKCRGYQFELGKQFDMPEGSNISLCDSGFHFCTSLRDVFNYYDVENGNRFFKVRALVRKKKKEEPGLNFYITDSKETSKSIEFISELTTDEILAKKYDAKDFSDAEKELARKIGVPSVINERRINELESLGYALDVANYIVLQLDKFAEARVLAKQTDISMDTRIMVLFNGVSKAPDFSFKRFNVPSYGTIAPLTSNRN